MERERGKERRGEKARDANRKDRLPAMELHSESAKTLIAATRSIKMQGGTRPRDREDIPGTLAAVILPLAHGQSSRSNNTGNSTARTRGS